MAILLQHLPKALLSDGHTLLFPQINWNSVKLTGSIREENVIRMRHSLKYFVSKFVIGPDESQVSLETFAEFSTLQNSLNDTAYHSEQAILELIDAKVRGPLTHPTRLDRALNTADQQMFTLEKGIRIGYRHVMVLLTDGKTNPASEDFSSAVNSLKVIHSFIS